MTTPKKKSNRIAQVGRVLAKAGLSAAGGFKFGPGGAIAAAGISEIVDQAVSTLVENRRKRIGQFHVDLFAGKTDKERHKLLSRIQNDEEAAAKYATILEKVAQDDEEAKTALYAKLLRFVLDSPAEPTIKQHLIRYVRELAFSDLHVLATLNIIGGAPPENASPTEGEAHIQHQQEYAERGDPLIAAAVQRLEHGGFVVRASVVAGNRLDVTSLGKLLLETLG